MSTLISYIPGRFSLINHLPGVKIFLGIFKIFNDNISFIDRSNIIIPPIKVETLNHIKLPELDPNFNLSFRDCAMARAEEIYKKHLEFNVPIRVGWSGGIDSSAALMSFIELLGVDKAKQVLEISMTEHCIVENPWVWERIVRKNNFTIINAMRFSEKWDGSEIGVNGECGDQVNGTDIYRALIKLYGQEALTMLWTPALIVNHVKTFTAGHLSDKEAEFLADLFINQVKQCELEIVTLADFWWWLNFSCKWASVFYRILLKSPHSLSEQYVDNYFFPFYASEKFQLWSMYKREEKHQGSWTTYKWKAKEFVIETSGCPEFDFKHRHGSLYSVVAHTKKFEAIDNEFNFYTNIDPEAWYNPNNSFRI
jgi:hypothetical protein